jgi:hypothetical protein
VADEKVGAGYVFGEGLWPVGWSVGFIEAPLSTVSDAVEKWEPFSGTGLAYPDDDLGQLLQRLLPLEADYRRRLLVATSGAWTAYFDNELQGGDPFPWASHLSQALGCRGVTATHVPVEQYPYPTTSLEIFSPDGEPPLMYLRTVHAGIYDEGRWRFEAWGKVQPFERPDLYKARRVRERLTRDTLLEYLEAMGITADRADWYGGGVLYEEDAALDPARVLTLEEARQEYGQ